METFHCSGEQEEEPFQPTPHDRAHVYCGHYCYQWELGLSNSLENRTEQRLSVFRRGIHSIRCAPYLLDCCENLDPIRVPLVFEEIAATQLASYNNRRLLHYFAEEVHGFHVGLCQMGLGRPVLLWATRA